MIEIFFMIVLPVLTIGTFGTLTRVTVIPAERREISDSASGRA